MEAQRQRNGRHDDGQCDRGRVPARSRAPRRARGDDRRVGRYTSRLRGGRSGSQVLRYDSHDAVAAPAQASDVAWMPGIIAERAADDLDALAHGLGADDNTRPDLLHQLIDRNEVGRSTQQCEQQVERDACDSDSFSRRRTRRRSTSTSRSATR